MLVPRTAGYGTRYVTACASADTGSATSVGEPVRTFQRPKDRRARPKRWADAVDQLRTLQAEYEAWRDQLPESLADSSAALDVEGVCDVDLDTLDVELPRGFGQD